MCHTVTVPTYILGPNKEEDRQHYKDLVDGEVCTNLTYLGKRGVYTLTSGVKIAYLSGVEAAGNVAGEHEFNKADVQAVRNSCLVSKNCATDYRGVDVLLTSQWPYGLQEGENVSSSHLGCRLFNKFATMHILGKGFQADLVSVPRDQTTLSFLRHQWHLL